MPVYVAGVVPSQYKSVTEYEKICLSKLDKAEPTMIRPYLHAVFNFFKARSAKKLEDVKNWKEMVQPMEVAIQFVDLRIQLLKDIAIEYKKRTKTFKSAYSNLKKEIKKCAKTMR